MEQHLWTDGKKIGHFGSRGKDNLSDDSQTLNSNHKTLKTVKHGGASIMIWGCFSYCVFTGPRSWSTPSNTDMKQFSETEIIQLNISSVIHRKDKTWSISQFTQYMFELMQTAAAVNSLIFTSSSLSATLNKFDKFLFFLWFRTECAVFWIHVRVWKQKLLQGFLSLHAFSKHSCYNYLNMNVKAAHWDFQRPGNDENKTSDPDELEMNGQGWRTGENGEQ